MLGLDQFDFSVQNLSIFKIFFQNYDQ